MDYDQEERNPSITGYLQHLFQENWPYFIGLTALCLPAASRGLTNVTIEGVLFFHQNFSAMGPKFRVFEKKKKKNFFSIFFYILECNSFSPEF